MLYNYKEVIDKYKNDYNIKKAISNNEIYKITKGIYSESPYVSHLAILMKKYPNCVISGHSAYYYYDLTDVIPKKIIICTNRDATRIHDDDVKQIRMQDKLYELGITTMEYNGTIIRIYDKERLLLELVRNKNKMGYDLYKEIISNYRNIIDSIDIRKIEKYLPYFINEDKLLEKLQDEVF